MMIILDFIFEILVVFLNKILSLFYLCIAFVLIIFVIVHNIIFGSLEFAVNLLFSLITKHQIVGLLLVGLWFKRELALNFLYQSCPLIATTAFILCEFMVSFLLWFWHSFICITFNHPELQQVPKQLSLKLAIDKGKKRVLFAECDKDLVDVIYSFLTMPMGTIVRLAEGRSGIGCMDHLYKSVEDLDEQFLQTKACKTMLLNPRNAYGIHCKSLILKIDDAEPAKHYTCSKVFCYGNNGNRKGSRLVSMVENSICSCGAVMDKEVFLQYRDEVADRNGVFMRGTRRFMITDDLQINPISVSESLKMFEELKMENGNGVEVRNLPITEAEVLLLLKRSLLSKTPMTDTFLLNGNYTENVEPFEPPSRPDHRPDHQKTISSRRVYEFQPITVKLQFRPITVKLLIHKTSRRVLCLEGKEDFVNLLLSFLTFPLGSIIKLLGGSSSLGSIDKLYGSLRNWNLGEFFKSRRHKNMLLNPKLPLDFSIHGQPLIGEEDPTNHESYRCSDCFRKNMVCLYPWIHSLCFMNPKLPGRARNGGGFVKEETLLLINDELTIQPLSPIDGILDLDKLQVLVSNSEAREVQIGEYEALTLLKASLISKSVLNHVFKLDEQGQMLG